jgi:hypothetical protein
MQKGNWTDYVKASLGIGKGVSVKESYIEIEEALPER